MRMEDDYIEKLRKENLLPKSFIRAEKNVEEDSCEYYDEREDLLNHFNKWVSRKHNIETYVLFHSCHNWNSTFGLTLAKLVIPDEEAGVKHKKHFGGIVFWLPFSFLLIHLRFSTLSLSSSSFVTKG